MKNNIYAENLLCSKKFEDNKLLEFGFYEKDGVYYLSKPFYDGKFVLNLHVVDDSVVQQVIDMSDKEDVTENFVLNMDVTSYFKDAKIVYNSLIDDFVNSCTRPVDSFYMVPEQVEFAKEKQEALVKDLSRIENEIKVISDITEHKFPDAGDHFGGNGFTNCSDEIVRVNRISDEINELQNQINHSLLPEPSGDKACYGSLLEIVNTSRMRCMNVMIVEGVCDGSCRKIGEDIRLCTADSPMAKLLGHEINDVVTLDNGQNIAITAIDNDYIDNTYGKKNNLQKSL